MRKIFFALWIFLLSFSCGLAVEVNNATASQLMKFKGIGAKTAEAILRERQRAGAFVSWQDFSLRVKGMGKKKVELLVQQGMTVNGQVNFLSSTTSSGKGRSSVVKQQDTHQTAEGKIMYVRPKQVINQ